MENTLEMQPLRAVGEIDKPPQPVKTDIDLVERADTNTTIPATYVDAVAARLSKGHRDYLIERHGTLDLDPVPGISPTDPYNWPAWKVSGVNGPMSSVKHANYSENDEPDSSCLPRIDGNLHGERHHPLVQRHHQGIRRLHAAGELSHITTNRCSGGAPLLWKPLSNRFGRRPIFLLSLICSLVCNVGCAKSPDYASTAACRALGAFFISPASAIGSAVVMETTFKKDRAKYMGVWMLMATLGVPSGPFIFGFVAYRAGYRWIYWVLAMVSSLPSSALHDGQMTDQAALQ